MVDIGLNIETDPSPAPGSSRLARYPSLSELYIPATRASSSRSLLRVTPHYSPRPLVEPSPALRSLLVGAQLSHYNYLAGSVRTPTKEDYFHEKTLIYNFQPSFKASYFAHSRFEMPRGEERVMNRVSEPAEPRKVATALPQARRPSSRKLQVKQKPTTETVSRPLARTYTTCSLRLSQFPKTNKPRPRPILCIEDGQNLQKPRLKTHLIDFLEYVQKYIGFVPHPESQPCSHDSVSLRNQALMDLLETVTLSLKPAAPFTSIFTVDGTRIEDLSVLSQSCRVLLFSSSAHFQGLQDA